MATVAGGTATEVKDDQIQPGTLMALVAMGLGVFVIANDFTALNVALPAIEGDLNADVGSAAMGDQRLRPRLRHGDRLRRPPRRHVRPPPDLLHRLDPVRRLLGARRGRPRPGRPDRRPGRDGDRRRADVARDPRHDVRGAAGVEGGTRRRADPRRRRHRQRGRPAARRRAHRGARLALDLRRQRPDRRLRDVRHLAQRPPGAGAVGRAHRLRRHGGDLRRAGPPAARAGPVRRLGLGRSAGDRDARPRRRPDRRLRLRSSGAPARAR